LEPPKADSPNESYLAAFVAAVRRLDWQTSSRIIENGAKVLGKTPEPKEAQFCSSAKALEERPLIPQ
jgi:hypothetical protein